MRVGGEVAAVVALSLDGAGSNMPFAGRLLLLGLLVTLLGALAAVVVGAEHVGQIIALVNRLADTSAQIRVRLPVLAVAGLALAARQLGIRGHPRRIRGGRAGAHTGSRT